MILRLKVIPWCIALTTVVTSSITAQPSGPGWEPDVCPSTIPQTTLRATLSNGHTFLFTVELRLQNYVNGNTQKGHYTVFPSNSSIQSDNTVNGHHAEWIGGGTEMTCWQRHTVMNGVPITDRKREQSSPQLEGSFSEDREDEYCDENGNPVPGGPEEGGIPCDPTQEQDSGAGGESTPSNCVTGWAAIDKWDDQAGWVEVWEGTLTVCTDPE